jgi:hypothetical protein
MEEMAGERGHGRLAWLGLGAGTAAGTDQQPIHSSLEGKHAAHSGH